ncbi:uncharacterized protein EAF02_000530 [Botrytis sinoallii]|uniref:uncharacterized protein n=1 Tax=Botrytis sinoallii TaxID=1463999 RepID=UPI001900854E|nr:uncharacterized protein EAF02_000530 [Botrytis sinoallii]KAF7892992.1 hypothetical protein EAF02_000530 [Botrytis sinoallii]
MPEQRSKLLESLEQDGFVLIPSLLSQAEIDSLRIEAKKTVDLARSGSWPYVRTLPKQFPPWNVGEGESPAKDGIWGVQSLMNPKLATSSSFIKIYFSDKMLGVVKELLQSEPAWHAQWNMALYDDSSLIVVPKSHKRARTAAERDMSEYETGVQGEIRVEMKAGDVVFYDNNILHRGGKYESGRKGNHYTGVGFGDIDLSVLTEEEKKRAEGMRKRLLGMAEESGEKLPVFINIYKSPNFTKTSLHIQTLGRVRKNPTEVHKSGGLHELCYFFLSQIFATEIMDRQARINEAKQEVDAMFEGLDDSDAADIVEICQNAIDTIEMRRAKKLRVFDEFYKPLSVSDTDENSSVETTQKITHKSGKKKHKNELNFQVMIAERKEHLEDLKNEKQI